MRGKNATTPADKKTVEPPRRRQGLAAELERAASVAGLSRRSRRTLLRGGKGTEESSDDYDDDDDDGDNNFNSSGSFCAFIKKSYRVCWHLIFREAHFGCDLISSKPT